MRNGISTNCHFYSILTTLLYKTILFTLILILMEKKYHANLMQKLQKKKYIIFIIRVYHTILSSSMNHFPSNKTIRFVQSCAENKTKKIWLYLLHVLYLLYVNMNIAYQTCATYQCSVFTLIMCRYNNKNIEFESFNAQCQPAANSY